MNESTDFSGSLGIAWYRADQWKHLREISADVEDLEETWYEWYRTAEQRLKEYAETGIPIEKVPVEVESLLKWCEAEGRPVDGAARAHYAAELLRQRDRRAE